MAESTTLGQNYEKVLKALEKACQRAGRRREDITLVAVSKFHSASDIRSIVEAGQLDFGENYLQEAEEKKYLLADCKDIRWHMIGHVQSRKAPAVAGNFTLLHSLDSIKLANSLEKALIAKGVDQDVLIEVNIAGEAQKAGISQEELQDLVEHVESTCPHIKLKGLMCLPPVFNSGDAARPFFARLYELREIIGRSLGRSLPHLSMGMSGDFASAIEEGANIVRIGTDIFGPRPIKKRN